MSRPSIALIANPRSGSSDPDRVASHLRAAGAHVELFALDEADRPAASGASRIELGAPADAAFNVDGELVRHGPASFTAEAGAFRLVVG